MHTARSTASARLPTAGDPASSCRSRSSVSPGPTLLGHRLLVVVHGGQVVIVEQLGHQFRAAADGELGEDRLGVVTNGVPRDPQRSRYVVDRQAAKEKFGDMPLARGELVH